MSAPLDYFCVRERAIAGTLLDPGVVGIGWNPGGLWRPVRIDSTGPGRIDRLRVLCRDANDARAHLRLHARLDNDLPRSVVVRTSVDGEPVAEQSFSLAHGLNEIDWNLDVNDPRLWWPWTMGDQHLTDVQVEVVVDGTTSDQRAVRTGLREVAMTDWVISVNGEPLFVKGINVGPTRHDLAHASADEVRRDVELARGMGLDLVRLNGHIARSEFYAAADELGMLVWQDFPLQWGYARSVRREAVRQAREAVDLLDQHQVAAYDLAFQKKGDQAATDAAGVVRAVKAAGEAILRLGGAEVGDKTMVDALVPWLAR